MGKPKTGRPVGRPNAFENDRLQWLDEKCDEFRNSGDTGAFYTRVTQSFIQKFGYIRTTDGRLDEDLTQEEKVDLYKKMRKKFSNWFRARTKENNKPLIQKILSITNEIAHSRPRKRRLLQAYSAQYYKTKIKPGFDAYWALQRGVLPAFERLAAMAEWIRESWENESESFREEFTKIFEEQYQAELERYNAGITTVPTAAEARAQAWANFDVIAVTLSDALAEYLGGPVFIMTTVPVGADNGEINVRMSQSRILKDATQDDGTTKKLFPIYNTEAYDSMYRALVEYGRAFFTEKECQERIITTPWECVSSMTPAQTNVSSTVISDEGYVSSASLDSNKGPRTPSLPAEHIPVPLEQHLQDDFGYISSDHLQDWNASFAPPPHSEQGFISYWGMRNYSAPQIHQSQLWAPSTCVGMIGDGDQEASNVSQNQYTGSTYSSLSHALLYVPTSSDSGYQSSLSLVGNVGSTPLQRQSLNIGEQISVPYNSISQPLGTANSIEFGLTPDAHQSNITDTGIIPPASPILTSNEPCAPWHSHPNEIGNLGSPLSPLPPSPSSLPSVPLKVSVPKTKKAAGVKSKSKSTTKANMENLNPSAPRKRKRVEEPTPRVLPQRARKEPNRPGFDYFG